MEIIAALLAFVLLTASTPDTCCSKASQTPRQWQQEECLLGTDSDNAITFHPAIYYPDELRPFEEGFLVGVEKAPVKKISGESGYGAGLETMQDQGGYADIVGRLKNEPKRFFISHIIEYPASPAPAAQKETFSKQAPSHSLYNVYARLRDKNENDVTSPLKDSWDAIEGLKSAGRSHRGRSKT